jgi:DNA mismatch repair protein MutL
VLIEGGRMRDVQPAAHPRGTMIAARDLFFNVPARRKFLRSEATENFHLTNLVTHYALAHPEIAFALTTNGRASLHAAPAANLRERAYQIFGAEFLESLLEVSGGHEAVARVSGYVSAPRERRTSRDAQYLFVNGRYVRDRLISRALSEGYRTVLPQGVYPAALLFLEVPLAEVDVNVHPAKTEVRFRRGAAVSDAVREAVRAALAAGGYVRAADALDERALSAQSANGRSEFAAESWREATANASAPDVVNEGANFDAASRDAMRGEPDLRARDEQLPQQETIGFGFTPPTDDESLLMREDLTEHVSSFSTSSPSTLEKMARNESSPDDESSAKREIFVDATKHNSLSRTMDESSPRPPASVQADATPDANRLSEISSPQSEQARSAPLPPLNSIAGAVREIPIESVSSNIRPLYQLEESYIIAIDAEGMLLIDQHAAHERILFDKYRKLEATRAAESQQLLLPETFDLTPAQAAAFDAVAEELETYGFSLMRLSGRTVAIKAVPADLPASEGAQHARRNFGDS